MFFRAQRSVVGIDVSDRSLEAVVLQRSWGKPTIAAYSRRELDFGVVEDGRILKPARLAAELQELRQRASPEPIRDHRCLVSLPESQVFSHVFVLPAALAADQVRRAILFEAEQFVPIPLAESYYDYLTISRLGDQQEVLYVATRRGLVHQYLEVFRAADLLPLAFEPESWSVARALVRRGADPRGTAVLVVDLGARTTNAHLVRQGQVVGSLTIPLAGEHWTQAIAAAGKLTEAEAEKRKVRHGLGGTARHHDEITGALLPLVQAIARAINRYVEYARLHRHLAVRQVVLAGGSALLPGLPEYLSANLHQPVMVGNPVLHLRSGPVHLLERQSVLYANVVGLALRGMRGNPEGVGLNLLAQARQRIRSDQLQRFLTPPRFDRRLAGKICALGLGLVVLAGLLWYRSQRLPSPQPMVLDRPRQAWEESLPPREHHLTLAFGDFGSNEPRPDGALSARWLHAVFQVSQTFAARGTTTGPRPASLGLTVVNKTPAPQHLVRQTRLQAADGTVLRLAEAVVVPANGMVVVVVPWSVGGTEVLAGRLTLPGLPPHLTGDIYGEIAEPDLAEPAVVAAIAPNDLQDAEATLRLELRHQAQERFVLELQAQEFLVPVFFPLAVDKFSSDQIAGTPVERFQASLQQPLGGVAVAKTGLEQAIRQAFGPLAEPLPSVSFEPGAVDLEAQEVSVIIKAGQTPVEK